jgi:hypothetical protein
MEKSRTRRDFLRFETLHNPPPCHCEEQWGMVLMERRGNLIGSYLFVCPMGLPRYRSQ